VNDVTSAPTGHPDDEELVLYHYCESPVGGAVETHLAECDRCRAHFEALMRVLGEVTAASGPVPEPGETFEARMWGRIEPHLAPRRGAWWLWLSPRRLALAGAVASLVVAAFVAGRAWRTPSVPAPPAQVVASAADRALVRERILLVAVGDHLDRSQMALIEISNAEPDGPVDIGWEQERVRDLVSSNRLLRQTVEVAGDAGLASVLDDLERVLLDIAHGPSELDAGDFSRIRERIESQGLLFKVRVAGAAVREREATVAAGTARTRS